MSVPISRRDALLKLALLTCGVSALPASRPAGAAAQLPQLKPTDPTAVALGYHEDAKQVDAKQFPNYRPAQNCSNCLQLKGDAGQQWRPCNLFPGKLVNADGWCRVWVKRP